MSELVSDCCSSAAWLGNIDLGICGACKEHCEFIELGDDIQ